MKVTLVDQPLHIDAAAPNPRKKGLHISEVYGKLFQKLDPERYSSDGEPHQVLMAIGLAWEQWLERTLIAMGELVSRPVDLVSPEGILYNPDLHILNGKERLGEIKATMMSSKEGINAPKFDKYHCQAKIYAYWTGITCVRFYVLFLKGDYKKGDGFPEFRVYDVDYTQQELFENHRMLMTFAKQEKML